MHRHKITCHTAWLKKSLEFNCMNTSFLFAECNKTKRKERAEGGVELNEAPISCGLV